MKEKIRDLVLSGLGGLVISYTAYFLILQNLSMPSPLRFGLVFGLLGLFTASMFLVRKRFQFNRDTLGGITALFLLLNLIVAVRVDFLNLPYTIPLLPLQTIHLTPGQDQTNLKIKSYGTELYTDLNFDQIIKEKGWGLDDKGHLLQEPGTAETITWTGKPGQYIYFEVENCPECSPLRIESQGEETTFILDESSLPTGRLNYQFPSLAWHRALNFLALEGALLTLSAILIFSGIRNRTTPRDESQKAIEIGFLKRIPADLWLILFPAVIFGFKISPVIFNDDWCQIIQPMHEGSFEFFNPIVRRPMHLSLHWIFYKLFPIQQAVSAMQVAHLIVIILIGLVMYRIFKFLLEDKDWLAFLGALLIVVYPSDYTYFYLSLLGTRFAYLCTLTALLLLARYLKTNRIVHVWAAVLLVLSGLLTYEGQFGIYLAWPLVIGTVFSFKVFRERIPGLAVYYLPAVIFPIWRFGIQPLFYQDSKFGHLTTVFSGILPSINWGIRTILGGFLPPYKDASWLTVENIFILSAALVLGLLIFIAARQAPPVSNLQSLSSQTHRGKFWLLAAGILLWGSGYFPILINYPPNIWGHLSRVNIFAVPGAVLILIALFQIITNSLVWKEQFSISAVKAIMILMIFLGSIVHVQVQQSFNQTWQETRSFYQQIINLAPDVADGTQFYIHLHGEDNTQTTHRPLITTLWEPRCAVEVFYDSAVTKVSYRYQQISTPGFPGINILGGNIQDEYLPILNPANLLVFSYDRQSKQVRLVEDISGYFGADFQEKYSPYNHIIPLEQENTSRELVD